MIIGVKKIETVSCEFSLKFQKSGFTKFDKSDQKSSEFFADFETV
jgi:hypothetical protein